MTIPNKSLRLKEEVLLFLGSPQQVPYKWRVSWDKDILSSDAAPSEGFHILDNHPVDNHFSLEDLTRARAFMDCIVLSHVLSFLYSSVTILAYFCVVPRCGFNRRKGTKSAQRSASTSEVATETTRPVDITLHLKIAIGPIIDAPIASSIPPLLSTTTTKIANTTVRLEASNGRNSSNRTVTSSMVLRARTPTTPLAPIVPGHSEQDKGEVTQAVRRSSLRIGSLHPAVQIHPLLPSAQVAAARLKRQRVGATSGRALVEKFYF